jgi:hypothetical protein
MKVHAVTCDLDEDCSCVPVEVPRRLAGPTAPDYSQARAAQLLAYPPAVPILRPVETVGDFGRVPGCYGRIRVTAAEIAAARFGPVPRGTFPSTWPGDRAPQVGDAAMVRGLMQVYAGVANGDPGDECQCPKHR